MNMYGMMVLHKFWLILCLVAAHVVRGEDVVGGESVVELDQTSFDEFLGKHENVLVKFYAPWCGHCKSMAPAYEEAAKILKSKNANVQLAKVDATKHQELAETHNIHGYPTMVLFRNKRREEYTGDRTTSGIIIWLEKMTGPAVRVLGHGELMPLVPERMTYFLGRFGSQDSPAYKAYSAVATESRTMGSFFAMMNQDAESIEVLRQNEDPYSSNNMTEDAIRKFVEAEHIALYGPIDQDNYRQYLDKPFTIAWVCGEPSLFEKTAPVMRKLSRHYRGKYAFVFLNIDQFKTYAEGQLDVNEFPAFVVNGTHGRYILKHSTTGTEKLDDEIFDEEKISTFMAHIEDGTIQKTFKSEPIPDHTGDAVKVVVGKNFNDIVLNSGKDVLLEIYAPWCGHCKQFEPIYNELGEKLKNDKSIIVAKMDGTLNESPSDAFTWRQFPTIFFLKAGETNPIPYDGQQTMDGLMSYIETYKSKRDGSASGAAVSEEL